VFHGDFDFDTEDTKPTGKASAYIARLWPYFRPYLGRILAAVAMLLVTSGLGLLGPVLMKRAIDVNIAQGDLRGLALTSLVYLGAQVFIIFAGYFQGVWLAQVGERGAANLKQALFAHVLNLPMRFFDSTPAGKLMSRVESDTEALKMLFTHTTVMLLQSALMLVGMSIIMATVEWRLYLLVLALVPPFVLVTQFILKRVRPLYVKVRRTVAEINNLVNETLRGLPVIQLFCQQDRVARRMDELNRAKYGQEMRAFGLWNIVWFMVDFGEIVGIGLVLGLGGVWAMRGEVTIGTLVLFVTYIARLFGPLRMLSDTLNQLQRSFASAERTIGILDQKPEEAEDEAKSQKPKAKTQSDEGRLELKQAIRIEDVDFAYDGENFVLKDIDLTLRKGEKVALVGETGGGKSSIVSLLLKFYRHQQGRILYDGVELSDIGRHRLRRAVGFVPQEVVMFPGTVLDNLRMLDESIPADVVKAAAQRCRVHDAIMRFEKGYDSVLTEGGANFSLGERQLLAFARALVRDPELLIFDEATSSVDPRTEALIQEGLEELLRGRTAVIVAHRLATIRMADRVVVVHKGRIAEEGTHDDLLARAGIYAKLYELQYVGESAA
jgi:ATP-binding cassette subfamily B protein